MPRWIVIAALAAVLTGCSTNRGPDPAALEAQAAAAIRAIPPADPHVYEGKKQVKAWRNPYLILRADGIGLVDLSNREIHILKPGEVTQSLARLPADAWPYGRVVAVEEMGGPDSDRVRIRANKGLLEGTLRGLQVSIEWIPAP